MERNERSELGGFKSRSGQAAFERTSDEIVTKRYPSLKVHSTSCLVSKQTVKSVDITYIDEMFVKKCKHVICLSTEHQGVHKNSQSRVENQQQTQPIYDVRSGNLNQGHIGWRRALSPLHHPCSPKGRATYLLYNQKGKSKRESHFSVELS